MDPFAIICLGAVQFIVNCILLVTVVGANPLILIIPAVITVLIILLILLILVPFSYSPPKHTRPPDVPEPRFVSRQRIEFNKTGKKHMSYDVSKSQENKKLPESFPGEDIYSNRIKEALRLTGNLEVEELSESTDEGIEVRIGEKVRKDRAFFLNNKKDATNFRSKRVNEKDVRLSYGKAEDGIFLGDILTKENVPNHEKKAKSISLGSLSLTSSESMNFERYEDSNFPKMDVIDIEGKEVIVQVESPNELQIALAIANHYDKNFCLQSKGDKYIGKSKTLNAINHHEKDFTLRARTSRPVFRKVEEDSVASPRMVSRVSSLPVEADSVASPRMVSRVSSQVLQGSPRNGQEVYPDVTNDNNTTLEIPSEPLHSDSVSEKCKIKGDDPIYSTSLDVDPELGQGAVYFNPNFEPEVPAYDQCQNNPKRKPDTDRSVSDSDDSDLDNDQESRYPICQNREPQNPKYLTQAEAETFYLNSTTPELSHSMSAPTEFIPNELYVPDEVQKALELISRFQSRFASLDKSDKNFKDSVVPPSSSISRNPHQSQVNPVLNHPPIPTSSPMLSSKLPPRSESDSSNKTDENLHLLDSNCKISKSKNTRLEEKVVFVKMQDFKAGHGVKKSPKVKESRNGIMTSSSMDQDDVFEELDQDGWMDFSV